MVEIYLVFTCGIEISLIVASGSHMTCFVPGSESTSVLCAGRRLLGFHLLIEVDFVFSGGIEIDMVFVCGQKTTWYLCGDRLTSFLCGWSERLRFCMVAENHLVSVGASNLTSYLCG